MLQVSALVCALPWVVELELDPLTPAPGQPAIGCVRIAVDPEAFAPGELRAHGDPSVSGGAGHRGARTQRRHRRHPPDPPEDAELERSVREQPVGRDALPALLLPHARAHAGDARPVHAGRLRPRARARRRRRGPAGRGARVVRRRGALHRESRPQQRRVRDRRARRLAATGHRSRADGTADRRGEAQGPRADSRARSFART